METRPDSIDIAKDTSRILDEFKQKRDLVDIETSPRRIFGAKKISSFALAGALLVSPIAVGAEVEVTPTIEEVVKPQVTPSELAVLQDYFKDRTATTPAPPAELFFRAMNAYDYSGYEICYAKLDAIGNYPKRRDNCAGWLYDLNNSDTTKYAIPKKRDGYDDIKTYVNEDQILNYYKYGTGLNVLMDESGEGILCLGFDEQMMNDIKSAVKWIHDISGGDEVVKKLKQRGLSTILAFEYHKDGSVEACDLSSGKGLMVCNFDKSTKFTDSDLIKIFYSDLMIESFGLGELGLFYSVGVTGDTKYTKVIKPYLAYLNWNYLRSVKYWKSGSDDRKLEKLCIIFLNLAKSKCVEGNISSDDPFLLEMIDVIIKNNLIQPIGADNWDFVKEEIGEIKIGKIESYTDQRMARYEALDGQVDKKDYSQMRYIGVPFSSKRKIA